MSALSSLGAYQALRLDKGSETWEPVTVYLGSWVDTLLRVALDRGEAEATTGEGVRYRPLKQVREYES